MNELETLRWTNFILGLTVVNLACLLWWTKVRIEHWKRMYKVSHSSMHFWRKECQDYKLKSQRLRLFGDPE